MENKNDPQENQSLQEEDQFGKTKKWIADVNRAMWDITGMAVKNRQAHIDWRKNTIKDLNLKLDKQEGTHAKIEFLFNVEKRILDLLTQSKIKNDLLSTESYQVVMDEFIIKQKKYYSERLKYEIYLNNAPKKIDNTKSDPPSVPESKPKILISDEVLIQNIIKVVFDNKFIDDFFKESFSTFLKTGKISGLITWKENKNILTTLFYLLHYNHKISWTKKDLAEAIHSSFHFEKNKMKQDPSAESILQDFQEKKHNRRIKPHAVFYKEFITLFAK